MTMIRGALFFYELPVDQLSRRAPVLGGGLPRAKCSHTAGILYVMFQRLCAAQDLWNKFRIMGMAELTLGRTLCVIRPSLLKHFSRKCRYRRVLEFYHEVSAPASKHGCDWFDRRAGKLLLKRIVFLASADGKVY